jgi:hypothetical protein
VPEGLERRQFPRYPMQLPLQHKLSASVAAGAGVGWTRDLSEGGARVELPEFLLPQVALQVRLHTGRGTIEPEAQVVWEAEVQAVWARESGPIKGGVLHGLAFTKISPTQLQALRNLLHSREEEGGHASVRLPLRLSTTCEPENQLGPPLLGVTEEISREELSLRLPHILPPGTLVRITLNTPHEPLTVKGTVVQVEPPERRRPGESIRHDVRFTTLGWYASLYLGVILTVLS